MMKRMGISLTVVLTICVGTRAAPIHGFTESFDGNGPYANIGGSLSGFDNPGWNLVSDGSLEDGGFRMSTGPILANERYFDAVERLVSGSGGFSSRVEIRNVVLPEITNPVDFTTSASIRLTHTFSSNGNGPNRASMTLHESDSTPPGKWLFAAGLDGLDQPVSQLVDQGENISIEMVYDAATSEVLFLYDPIMNDGRRPFRLGPFLYTGDVSDDQVVGFRTLAAAEGRVTVFVDQWDLIPASVSPGDFNGNGSFDVQDIDLLSEAVRSGDNELPFDLTADALVNEDDRRHWVLDLKNTYVGDANLDGEFASSDLINIFIAGEYGDSVALNSTWATGDWSGDGDFTTTDLVLAFTDGGYEAGPRAGVVAVPEPGSWLLLLFGGLTVFCRRR